MSCYVASYRSALSWAATLPVSVEKTFLSREPLPCNPAAETALQPLIWCSERESSHVSSSPEECFFHRRRYRLAPKHGLPAHVLLHVHRTLVGRVAVLDLHPACGNAPTPGPRQWILNSTFINIIFCGKAGLLLFVRFLFCSTLYQKFTRTSPSFHQNSPDFHHNFARISNCNTLKQADNQNSAFSHHITS